MRLFLNLNELPNLIFLRIGAINILNYNNSMIDWDSRMYTSAGSHGTTQLRARSILKDGFQLGDIGRKGKGVYFWYADKLGCEEARALAKAWFSSACNRGAYKGDNPLCGAIVWANLACEQSNVLELSSPMYRGQLRRLLEAHLPKDGKRIPEETVSKVHDWLIELIEKNRAVDIVVAPVSAPKMHDPLLPVLGDPFALIVKNLQCIETIPPMMEDIK